MARIQSTVGNSKFDIPPTAKRMVVEDESAFMRQERPERSPRQQAQLDQSEIPPGREINPAVAAGLRRQAQERADEIEHRAVHDARRRVELIAGLGRKTRDVIIEDPRGGTLTITLRSLKAFEQNCVSQEVERANRISLPNGKVGFLPTSLYNIKIEALAHALYLADGQSIDVVLGTANLDYEEQVQARKELLAEMDSALIDHLFVQYERLSQEVIDGYAPKNAEEAKEVVEAIRKSGANT